jgi:hypothetical protein
MRMNCGRKPRALDNQKVNNGKKAIAGYYIRWGGAEIPEVPR